MKSEKVQKELAMLERNRAAITTIPYEQRVYGMNVLLKAINSEISRLKSINE